MKYIKKFNKSTESLFDYKSRFTEIKSDIDNKLSNLKSETESEVDNSLLYILDNYEYKKDIGGLNDMYKEHFAIHYNIVLTNNDLKNRQDIISNFKSALEKLEITLGHKLPDDDNYLLGLTESDNIRFYTLNHNFHSFDEFESYINNTSLRDSVKINLTINF